MDFFCFIFVNSVGFFLSLVGKIELSGVKLLFWDLGGQDDLQSLWDKVRCGEETVFVNWIYLSVFLSFLTFSFPDRPKPAPLSLCNARQFYLSMESLWVGKG